MHTVSLNCGDSLAGLGHCWAFAWLFHGKMADANLERDGNTVRQSPFGFPSLNVRPIVSRLRLSAGNPPPRGFAQSDVREAAGIGGPEFGQVPFAAPPLAHPSQLFEAEAAPPSISVPDHRRGRDNSYKRTKSYNITSNGCIVK